MLGHSVTSTGAIALIVLLAIKLTLSFLGIDLDIPGFDSVLPAEHPFN